MTAWLRRLAGPWVFYTLLVVAVVAVVDVRVAEAGWYEYRYSYEYDPWTHHTNFYAKCRYWPWECEYRPEGQKEYEAFSHKTYLYESQYKQWERDLEYYWKWYRYYYDWVREEWGKFYYSWELWETLKRTVHVTTKRYYCETYEGWDPVTGQKRTTTSCSYVDSYKSSYTEYKDVYMGVWSLQYEPYRRTTIVKNDYRSEEKMEGPFTREGPYENRTKTTKAYDPPYYQKEWRSGPYDVIARVEYERDLQHNYWETRRDWQLRELQKWYNWRINYKYYTKTGYEKETSRQLLSSGTQDNGIVQTGYDVLKQWVQTIEGPYVWRNYNETRYQAPYTLKEWTSPPYTVPTQRWHDRFFWNVKFETKRDWALNEYRDYEVYEIQRKYYYMTDYYKIVGERLVDSGTEFLRTVQTGTDTLSSVTYRLGCVPSPDPVNAQKAQVVDLRCTAVAEGAGAQVNSIQALGLPNNPVVNFTRLNGGNDWLAKYFVAWFTDDGSYPFTIRVQGRDVEGNNITHDIPMTLNVGNVSPDRPVGTIIVD